MSAFPTQVLAAGLTALLLYVTHKYIFFVQEIIDYYKRCSEACQLTLFTFHVSAVIAIRLALEDFHPYVSTAACCFWILHSLRMRHWMTHFWSVLYVVLEASAACIALTERRLSQLLSTNLVVIGGFWLMMVAAVQIGPFMLLPLDRHLRRGFKHMRQNEDARWHFVHNLGSHGLMQTLTIAILALRGVAPAGLLATMEVGATYAAFALLMTLLLPPYRLPYVHIAIRGRDFLTILPERCPDYPRFPTEKQIYAQVDKWDRLRRKVSKECGSFWWPPVGGTTQLAGIST